MYPTFEKTGKATGDYKRIPICKELYADSYTPVEMMRILQKASHHCYLLESASRAKRGAGILFWDMTFHGNHLYRRNPANSKNQ